MTSQEPPPPLPKLRLITRSSIGEVLAAYTSPPITTTTGRHHSDEVVVVTFGARRVSAREWHEALQPAIWTEVFRSELNLLYPPDQSGRLGDQAPLGEQACSEVKLPLSLEPAAPSSERSRRISALAFGGSFDGCHEGHRSMLWYCLKILRLDEVGLGGRCTLYLGITPQRWVKRKPFGEFAYSLETRLSILRRCVELLLKSLNFDQLQSEAEGERAEEERAEEERVEEKRLEGAGFPPLHYAVWRRSTNSGLVTSVRIHISELDDAGVGIAGTARDLTHLLVTPDCLRGAEVVNATRRANSLEPVAFVKCDFLVNDQQDRKAAPVVTDPTTKRSSSKIRREVAEKYEIFAKRWNPPPAILKDHLDLLRSVILPSLSNNAEIRDDWRDPSTKRSISKIVAQIGISSFSSVTDSI